MTNEPKQPDCLECGAELACKSCNDTRPTAADLYAGWKLRTPLRTWETVKQASRDNEYAPVMVTTEERPDFTWEYARWTKVDAAQPSLNAPTGTPEVCFFDSDGDSSMSVSAGLDTTHYGRLPAWSEGMLAMAAFAGRGKGWWIQAQRGDGSRDDRTRAEGLSKSEARSELKKIGRDYAKRLKVKFTVQPPR